MGLCERVILYNQKLFKNLLTVQQTIVSLCLTNCSSISKVKPTTKNTKQNRQIEFLGVSNYTEQKTVLCCQLRFMLKIKFRGGLR